MFCSFWHLKDNILPTNWHRMPGIGKYWIVGIAKSKAVCPNALANNVHKCQKLGVELCHLASIKSQYMCPIGIPSIFQHIKENYLKIWDRLEGNTFSCASVMITIKLWQVFSGHEWTIRKISIAWALRDLLNDLLLIGPNEEVSFWLLMCPNIAWRIHEGFQDGKICIVSCRRKTMAMLIFLRDFGRSAWSLMLKHYHTLS